MVQISPRGLVAVPRGDSFTLELSLNVGTPLNIINFNMQEDDVACLRIFRANDKWEDFMVNKEASVEDVVEREGEKFIHFKFSHEDTNFLTADCYYYEFKMFYTRDDIEYVETIYPRTKIVITN